MHFTAPYDSPLGAITLTSTGNRLTGLWFNGQKHFAYTLGKEYEQRPDLQVFADTRRWLDIYFTGQKPDFTPPIEILATPFRVAVCRLLLNIPYGKTTSYGFLSQQIACEKGLEHFSAQAVAGAVAHNPISIIIPCHRVVGADGSLTGYAAGLHIKEQLLRLEASHKVQAE